MPYDTNGRSDIGLFVELLVFAALTFALLLIPLMRSVFPALEFRAPDETGPQHASADGLHSADTAAADMTQPLLSADGIHADHQHHSKVRSMTLCTVPCKHVRHWQCTHFSSQVQLRCNKRQCTKANNCLFWYNQHGAVDGAAP